MTKRLQLKQIQSQSVFDICNFAIAGESQSVIRVNSDSTPLGGGEGGLKGLREEGGEGLANWSACLGCQGLPPPTLLCSVDYCTEHCALTLDHQPAQLC